MCGREVTEYLVDESYVRSLISVVYRFVLLLARWKMGSRRVLCSFILGGKYGCERHYG
jgi:hypothetical protein